MKAIKFSWLTVMALIFWLQPTAHAQPGGRQFLAGHVPAAVSALTPVGRLEADRQLRLAIGLPLRNKEELTNLLQRIYDPASPDYRHYLTPAQFAETFGPTKKDYDAVMAFAATNGLAVTMTYSNRMLFDVAGSVSNIERALHVTLRTYRHPTENREFYAPDVEPSFDLSTPILHISGLDNYAVPRPMSLRPSPSARLTKAVPASGSGPSGTYMGIDFRAAYLPGVTLTGTGQSVGLLEFDSGYYQSDITTYENQAGLTNVLVKPVLLDGYNGGPGDGNDEVSLDIEMAISMAPGLDSVIVYEGSTTDDILNRMATDNLARQLSASWTYSIDAGSDQDFLEFAAQGQSFFNASGDTDAYIKPNDPPASPTDDPNLTSVGGTTLMTSGPGGAWVSETVWNWGLEYGSSENGVGSSGGISSANHIPSWQAGVSMSANDGSTTLRNLPDVALTADNIYVVYGNGQNNDFGGTSCATPLWAAFIALVNERAVAYGQPTVGFINPAIYALCQSTNYNNCFHDITTGSNTWSESPNNFQAVTGYDLCTGWGTPIGNNLLNQLVPLDALEITPGGGLVASGGAGGPLTPSSQCYTLTNGGNAILSWAAAVDASWLSISSGGGTLTPGGAAVMLTVSLNTAASNLFLGTYTATLWITNQTDGVVQSRPFSLTILKPPVIYAQPTNLDVIGEATATFSAGVAGGLPLNCQWQFNGTNLTDDGRISGAQSTLTEGGDLYGSMVSLLTISNVAATDAGTYSLVASNAAGVVVSSNAVLTVTASGPVIVSQPASQIALFGSTVQLAVTVEGSAPFTYQWMLNQTNLVDGGTISGSETPTLMINDVTAANVGNYTLEVSNAFNSAASTGAVLTVVAMVPGGQLVQNGGFETGSFSSWGESGNFIDCSVSRTSQAVHTGSYGALLGPSGSLGYLSQTLPTVPGQLYLLSLWFDSPDGLSPNEFMVAWNGTPLFDETNIGAIGWTNLQYYVMATGSNTVLEFGFRDDQSFLGLDDISASTLANADAAPIILTQPANQLALPGGTTTFSVLSAGQLPLFYQWQEEATNLPNATNATLSLTNVTSSLTGTYDVLVSNALGSATSSNALLLLLGNTFVTSTLGSWNGVNFVYPFGNPNTGTYGQTFVAPSQAAALTSFTVSMRNLSNYVNFQFYLMAWNGTEVTGPILYQSPVMTTSGAPGFQPYTFNIGNVALTPGATYVAFGIVTGNVTGQTGWAVASGYPYTGGQYVYNYSGTNFSALTDSAWSGISGLDLAFSATFAGPVQPGITGFTMSGANLVINGNDGLAGQTYYVLMGTNLMLPLSQWTSVATNIPGGTGNFTITLTNAVNLNLPQSFYILKVQ
jgi:Pro-kumamolisin, activation domain/Immunoglobulin domain